jgi:hypothetical protein
MAVEVEVSFLLAFVAGLVSFDCDRIGPEAERPYAHREKGGAQ